jgi:hypothetical protein
LLDDDRLPRPHHPSIAEDENVQTMLRFRLSGQFFEVSASKQKLLFDYLLSDIERARRHQDLPDPKQINVGAFRHPMTSAT